MYALHVYMIAIYWGPCINFIKRVIKPCRPCYVSLVALDSESYCPMLNSVLLRILVLYYNNYDIVMQVRIICLNYSNHYYNNVGSLAPRYDNLYLIWYLFLNWPHNMHALRMKWGWFREIWIINCMLFKWQASSPAINVSRYANGSIGAQGFGGGKQTVEDFLHE